MSKQTFASLVEPGPRMSSGTPVDILGRMLATAFPTSPGRGVPVLTVERKNTPEGFRSEITLFNCTCDPPLSCLSPSWRGSHMLMGEGEGAARAGAPGAEVSLLGALPASPLAMAGEEPDVRVGGAGGGRSAKDRRRRLARGLAQPAVEKDGAQG